VGQKRHVNVTAFLKSNVSVRCGTVRCHAGGINSIEILFVKGFFPSHYLFLVKIQYYKRNIGNAFTYIKIHNQN
jgi:hypothetical protein